MAGAKAAKGSSQQAGFSLQSEPAITCPNATVVRASEIAQPIATTATTLHSGFKSLVKMTDDLDKELDTWLAEAKCEDDVVVKFKAKLHLELTESLREHQRQLEVLHDEAMQRHLRVFNKNFGNLLERVLIGASESAFRKVKATLEARGVLCPVSEESVEYGDGLEEKGAGS